MAIVLCFTWTYQSIKAMSRNWELVERLNSDKKTLELLKMEVETAELENEYYSSNEYRELVARKYANKKLPGENMVYLPENSEESKNKHKETGDKLEDPKKDYSNIEKWMMYLFPGR